MQLYLAPSRLTIAGLILVAALAAAACAPTAPPAPAAPPATAVTKPASSASPSAPASAAPKPAPTVAGSPAAAAGASPSSSPSAKPAAAPAIDQSLAPTWAGKTVTFVAGDAAGGGYDTWSRLLARHLGKYLPGNPNFIVQNMPGASHRVATNFIYDAKPDGLTMGMVDRNIPSFQLQGEGPNEGVRYDVNKLTWVGSTTVDTQVLVVHERAGIKTTKDLETKTLKIGHTGPGGPPHTQQVALAEGLGWKFKSSFGYQGSSGVLLGIDRGEIDGMIISWSSLVRGKGDEIRAGTLIPVVQLGGGEIKDPLVGSAPKAVDLFKDKPSEAQQMMGLAQRPFDWSRSVIAPPGLDPRVAATMQAAFLATLADPELLAEATKLKLEVNPVSGQEVAKLVAAYMETPKDVVTKLGELIANDSNQ